MWYQESRAAAKPRAFISFEMEDRWSRDFLIEQAHQRNNDIEFIDYSLHEPFDEKWKTNCRERIAKTKGTIVMIGETTANSAPVLWEIAETNRLGHPIFGIQINRDKTHPIPSGLPATRVIRWNFDQIVNELGKWV